MAESSGDSRGVWKTLLPQIIYGSSVDEFMSALGVVVKVKG